jgi:dihydrofolate reductase
VTYQQWECYWPAAAKNPKSTQSNLDFLRFADETMKVVFSKTVKEVHWKNSRLVKGDITEEILRLKQLSGKDIAFAGGPCLAKTFIKLGLVDDYLFCPPRDTRRGQATLQRPRGKTYAEARRGENDQPWGCPPTLPASIGSTRIRSAF